MAVSKSQSEKSQRRESIKEDRSAMFSRLISLQVLLLALLLHFIVALATGNWTAGQNGISPMTWLASLGLPTMLALRQWNVGAVSLSGVFAILQIGFILTLASYSFFTAFASHMVISEPSAPAGPNKQQITKRNKKSLASIYSEMLLGLYVTSIHILEYGMGSPAKSLDFGNEFLHSWLSVIFMGSLCVVIGESFTSTLCRSMAKGTVIGTGFFIGHLLAGRIDMSYFTTVRMGAVGGLLAALCSTGIQLFILGRRQTPAGSKEYRSEDFGLHILTTLLTGLLLPRVLMIIESNYLGV